MHVPQLDHEVDDANSSNWLRAYSSSKDRVQYLNEKALRETQTLRAGCSKAKPKIFAPPQTLPGAAGRPKFNQLEMVTTLQLQTQIGEDRCTQFRVIVVTDQHTHTHTHKQTNKPTDRSDYNTLRR